MRIYESLVTGVWSRPKELLLLWYKNLFNAYQLQKHLPNSVRPFGERLIWFASFWACLNLFSIFWNIWNKTMRIYNGIRNIMEDQYALKPALRQTSLFRLKNVKLMMTTYNNKINDYFWNYVYGNYSIKS